MVSGHLVALNKNTVAAISGGLIMAIAVQLSEKKDLKWLKEWLMAIALFGGMIVAAVL